MDFIETGFDGLVEIQPTVFKDKRGYFFESYQKEKFAEAGIHDTFVQSNQSSSLAGVVRGLHLQLPPFAQSKLVQVIEGEIMDVVVDVRPSSKTFGQHYTCILSGQKKNMLYVPHGFAHGFVSLKPTVFLYFCDNIYNRDYEAGIIWNDTDLNIDWLTEEPIVSEKDGKLPEFKEFLTINTY